MTNAIRALVLVATALIAGTVNAAAPYKIVTADQRGTYFAIGSDLASMVAPAADIDLEVVPTDGSAANIKLLRFEPGVKFAIVQADVYQAFVERGRASSAAGGRRSVGTRGGRWRGSRLSRPATR